MRAVDPGHAYVLECYDTKDPNRVEVLHFMKREGEGYPGNYGHYSGTNCQEVVRVLIDRVKYLEQQIPCDENQAILHDLRHVLWLFEVRAARRRGHEPMAFGTIEDLGGTCVTCGHVNCRKEHP